MQTLPLNALYPVDNERAIFEELEYNLLYRWFLDMDLLERCFDATVFTKNRLLLLEHDAGRILFNEGVWTTDGEGRTLQCGRDPDRVGRHLQEFPAQVEVATTTR